MSFIAVPLLLIFAQPAGPQAEFPTPSSGAIRVDRGLQVIVYPDRVRLQYDLGLSAPAATAMLEQNSRDLPDSEDRRALMEAFRDIVLPDIQRRCRITADGKPLEIHAIESLLFPKHYVQLTCIFEAALPAVGDTIHLRLVDGSFRGCEGNHLIALKTDDGVKLQSSTVPLILARVPRRSQSSDSAAQREAARRAEAVVQRDREPIAAAAETPEVSFATAPRAEEPAVLSSAPADTRWTLLMCVIGCCAGMLAVIVVCWRRIR